jgi:hypothetical protein
VIGDVQKNLVEKGKRKRGQENRHLFFFLVVPTGTTQLIETGVLENKNQIGLSTGWRFVDVSQCLTTFTPA